MNRLEPLSTYASPSRVAVVRIAAESEPEPASVSAYAQSHSPLASRGSHLSFCSLAPASFSPSEPSSCTARMSAEVAHTFATSSIAISAISVPVPRPPCASSKKSPKMSFSRKSSTTSHGNSCEASISAARGAIRSRASVRTRSRSSRCSGVSSSQAMTDRLDVVAVRVENVRTVVVLVVPAHARRAVVNAAGGETRGMECVDGRSVFARERDVHAGSERLALLDEEDRVARPESGHAVLGPLLHDAHAQRSERLLVERAARLIVLHVETDVVEHART